MFRGCASGPFPEIRKCLGSTPHFRVCSLRFFDHGWARPESRQHTFYPGQSRSGSNLDRRHTSFQTRRYQGAKYSEEKKMEFWEPMNNTQGAPDNTEKRIKNPIGSSENMEINRWMCYVNMNPDRDSSFNDMPVCTVGSVVVEIHFVQTTGGGANYPPLAMVFVSPERRYIVLQDAVTNVWSCRKLRTSCC